MSRIGLIGCGAWGRHILRDLKACGAIVHVVAPSETSRRNATEHHADSIVSRLNELPAVDGYIVAASTSRHAEIIEALASGRAQVAEQAMRAHLLSVEQRLRLDRLPERTVDLQEVLAAGCHRSRFAARRASAADVLAPGE